MKLKKKQIFVIALALVVLAGVGVYAATSYGTESDPLITKSYLDKVVQPALEKELASALEDAEQSSSLPGEFAEVKLTAGQRIVCGTGGELVLTSGSAKASGSLTDTTAGAAASDGSSISANHLYLAAAADSGFSASGNAVVLVCGTYAVK